MKKTKLLQVRLTDKEDEFIDLKMREHNYKNKSEYVLNSIISPLKHDKKRSMDMIYEVNKIGVNLNQALRKMHALNIVSVDLLNEIAKANDNLTDVLKRFSEL